MYPMYPYVPVTPQIIVPDMHGSRRDIPDAVPTDPQGDESPEGAGGPCIPHIVTWVTSIILGVNVIFG